MSAEKKLSAEELKKLCYEIIEEMTRIWLNNEENTQKGLIRQKTIINQINAHPEVLRMRTRYWAYETIGIVAVCQHIFYVTIRALEDAVACELQDRGDWNVYDYIKNNDSFRKRIVNSWQYKRLVTKQEKSLISKEVPQYDDDDLFSENDDLFDEDKNEDMSKYDSIVE